MTFGDKVLDFYDQLEFTGPPPPDVHIMNPFKDNPLVNSVVRQFYGKFYRDNETRYMILGINPGRFGAGVTGIPFTDTKRLNERCGILLKEFQTHEPSSVFVYDVIEAFGGVYPFYKRFYIGAVSPLGFTTTNSKGRTVNYNYYDSKELYSSAYDFIIDNIKKQLDFGIERDACFCLGSGKNKENLDQINREFGFFKDIIALEHPRFIMQYRTKKKDEYVNRYIAVLKQGLHSQVNPELSG